MARYAFLRDDTEDETLHVYKSTADPTVPGNWSSVETYRFDGEIYDLCAFVQGSDIHLAVSVQKTLHGVDSEILTAYDRRDVLYLRFDPATDNFDITEESADFNGRGRYVGVAVRSDGDVVLPYQLQAPDTTTATAETAEYSRREAGTWTRETEVDAAASGSADSVQVTMGTSDRALIVYQDTVDLRAKSLTSANVLGSETTIETVAADEPTNGPPISYTHSATDYWLVVHGVATCKVARATQVDTPSWSDSTLTLTEPDDDATAGIRAQLVLDGNTEPYTFLNANSDNDIDSHLAATGPDTWAAAVSEVSAITCRNLSAYAYNRSGEKIGVLYDNAGTLAFYEKDLGGAPPVTIKMLALMGVGQ